ETPFQGDIEFRGTELAADETRLMVQRASWPDPIEADPATWGVTASDSFVLARIAQFAGGTRVLPGQYFASITTVTQRIVPDGGGRRLETTSNQVPFAVAPRIDTIVFPGTLTGRWFNPDLLPGDVIQLYIGADRLTRITPNPPPPAPPNPPAAGEFQVIDET